MIYCTRFTRIESTLTNGLNPAYLEILDQSHLHADHTHKIIDQDPHASPLDTSAQTHFKIKIVSRLFEGKSRLERHRIVNELLRQEWTNGLHSVRLIALTPIENNTP